MNIPFSGAKERAIFVATKILYPRELQEKPRPTNSPPLYQEVVFTDRANGRRIARVRYEKSPIAKMFPKAPIHPDVEVRSGYRVWDVARATLADLYLTAPSGWKTPRAVIPRAFFHGIPEPFAHRTGAFAGRRGDGHSMRELRTSNPAEQIESYVYENTFGFTVDERKLEIKNHLTTR